MSTNSIKSQSHRNSHPLHFGPSPHSLLDTFVVLLCLFSNHSHPLPKLLRQLLRRDIHPLIKSGAYQVDRQTMGHDYPTCVEGEQYSWNK